MDIILLKRIGSLYDLITLGILAHLHFNGILDNFGFIRAVSRRGHVVKIIFSL